MESTESKINKSANQSAAMEKSPPKRKSVWSHRDRIIRLLWGTIGRFIWTIFPCFRITILKIFGGKIGKGCIISSSVEITVPWNIKMGDYCHIGNNVILYSLGQITLGNNVKIDTRAHLCAGSHDMRDTTFPLIRPPITIGNNSFIGVDAYIGPNVCLGENISVHPRASVYKSFDGNVELLGNPARPIS